jgi:4,5-dihydroxyphthalate decarboxylase
MSGKLKLTVACGDYEIVRALKEGAVQPDGIELVMLTGMGSKERHWRMARKSEFDVCEVNVGGYFMSRDRGEALTAIPVYLHRRFQPASNIWMRGILEENYGFPHKTATWVVEREEDVQFETPKDLRIEKIAPGKRLDVMLAEGEIPAMLSPTLPKRFIEGDKRIVRLFPDYKTVELAYFKNTGIFPIMHVTVVKQEIVDKYPWVAVNLTKAFEEAKNLAYRRMANPRVVPLAWIRTAWEEQEEVLGPDPWAYGLGPANRKNLEAILRYTRQQGLLKNPMTIDELFLDTDLQDAGGPDEPF